MNPVERIFLFVPHSPNTCVDPLIHGRSMQMPDGRSPKTHESASSAYSIEHMLKNFPIPQMGGLVFVLSPSYCRTVVVLRVADVSRWTLSLLGV